MSRRASAVVLPKYEARSWLERSLASGHEVSAAVLETAPFESGSFVGIVPSGVNPSQIANFAEGGVVTSDVANAALAGVLDGLTQEGASCVIVEDDVGRRTDPSLATRSVPSAFIGDRVVSWAVLDQTGSGTVATETIGMVSSGYPRNAFVITKSAVDLGLSQDQSLPADFAANVAASTLAVIVSAFDDESFLIWSAKTS